MKDNVIAIWGCESCGKKVYFIDEKNKFVNDIHKIVAKYKKNCSVCLRGENETN